MRVGIRWEGRTHDRPRGLEGRHLVGVQQQQQRRVHLQLTGGRCEMQDAYILAIRAAGLVGLQQIVGAPELVVEIGVTSTEIDLGPKLALYRRAGVREYITFEVGPQLLTWRTIGRDGSYHTLRPHPDGTYRAREFPGLWLDPKALIANRSLLPTLRKGLRSPEHKAFRALMRSRAPKE